MSKAHLRHPWLVTVYDAMIESGEELTSTEIGLRWSKPEGRSTVAMRMANAVSGSWFRAIPIPGTRFFRYKAIPHIDSAWVPRDTHPVAPFARLGRGFARVSSVFELAGHL